MINKLQLLGKPCSYLILQFVFVEIHFHSCFAGYLSMLGLESAVSLGSWERGVKYIQSVIEVCMFYIFLNAQAQADDYI